MSLSVVVSAYNNQDVIEDCLKSIAKLANEIIVVDNGSHDDTPKIAKKYGAKVLSHQNNPLGLNQAKNFGFTKATGDWILSLDTDERISPELAAEIRQVIQESSSEILAYQFPRKNIIFGQWIKHGLWYPDTQIRLFRRNQGKFAGKHNHEKLQVLGTIGNLTSHIIHYNYTSVTQYLDKINHLYSDNEAQHFISSGKKVAWYDAIRMPISDFLTNFFARDAYKDGLHGLTLSLLQAFYTFVVFAKIWEQQGFEPYNQNNFLPQTIDEIKAKAKEFNYWYRRTRKVSSLFGRVKKIFIKNN